MEWRTDEVRQVGTDQALHLYPPPFTEQGADIAAVSRRPVPVHESWSVAQEFRRQLGPG
ncbi:DUF2625 family protein [Solirubrobacter taibaiensis]|nr:DUF2625 family protein [Solirubrobacter taibaiensis]